MIGASTGCTLCRPDLGPIIAEGIHWRLVLNHNQDLLGKCFLVTRRHVERVDTLSGEEWLELHLLLARTRRALDRAFAPDHCNYAFLQNQDRHVHLHVVPRYASDRTFQGMAYTDPGYPGHYRIDDAPDRLDPDREQALAALLVDAWARSGNGG
jgi:diadenosine tetraphosphate (Ap4A) HIT family hydrolase